MLLMVKTEGRNLSVISYKKNFKDEQSSVDGVWLEQVEKSHSKNVDHG